VPRERKGERDGSSTEAQPPKSPADGSTAKAREDAGDARLKAPVMKEITDLPKKAKSQAADDLGISIEETNR